MEVGWVLHRDWWGRGLATEGGRAGLDGWREHLDDAQLISITTPANRHSCTVMERLGLTYRGRPTGTTTTSSGTPSTGGSRRQPGWCQVLHSCKPLQTGSFFSSRC
ncbi:MAG: GNAT family N-acetyltransferase [Gaiellaceae bacterium]